MATVEKMRGCRQWEREGWIAGKRWRFLSQYLRGFFFGVAVTKYLMAGDCVREMNSFSCHFWTLLIQDPAALTVWPLVESPQGRWRLGVSLLKVQ